MLTEAVVNILDIEGVRLVGTTPDLAEATTLLRARDREAAGGNACAAAALFKGANDLVM